MGCPMGNADVFGGGNESDNFWQHLKAAGFISGNPADAGLPLYHAMRLTAC